MLVTVFVMVVVPVDVGVAASTVLVVLAIRVMVDVDQICTIPRQLTSVGYNAGEKTGLPFLAVI